MSFRKLLLNRCQKEFEKYNVEKQALLEKHNQLKGLSVGINSVKHDKFYTDYRATRTPDMFTWIGSHGLWVNIKILMIFTHNIYMAVP